MQEFLTLVSGLSFLQTSYVSGIISLSFMLLLSQVSVPTIMSGFSHSMKVSNSSTLLLKLWKFILTSVSSSILVSEGGLFGLVEMCYGEEEQRPSGKG